MQKTYLWWYLILQEEVEVEKKLGVFFLDNESIIYAFKYPSAVCDKDAKTLEVNLTQYFFFSLLFLQENFSNQFSNFWPLGEIEI